MPLTCILCSRTRKLNSSLYTTITDVDVEYRIKQAYKNKNVNSSPLPTTLLNQTMHKKCYWQYLNQYTYRSKKKHLSNEVQPRLARLPLADRTNNQFSSSSEETASTNRNPQQNVMYKDCVFVDSSCTSWLKTLSSTTSSNEKVLLSPSLSPQATVSDLYPSSHNENICLKFPDSEQIFNDEDAYALEDVINSTPYDNNTYSNISHNGQSFNDHSMIDLEEDILTSSTHIDPKFLAPLELTFQSSSIEQIYQKNSFNSDIQSSIIRKETYLDELIGINDRNKPSLIPAKNLDLTTHDNNTYLNISHSEKSCNDHDMIDLEEEIFNSSTYVDPKLSSSFDLSSILSSPNELSSVEQVHQNKLIMTNIQLSEGEKELNFDDLIEMNDRHKSSPIIVQNLYSRSNSNQNCSTILDNGQSFNDEDAYDLEDIINSTPYNNNTCTNISHNGQSFNDHSMIDLEEDILISSTYIDPKSSSSSELPSTEQIHRNKSSKTNIYSRLRSCHSRNIPQDVGNDSQYTIDGRTKSFLYDDSFSELCGWLENLLRDGFLVSLILVKDKYAEILRLRKEPITEGIIRTTSIRDRLQTKFKDCVLFTKVSHRQGLFISWNDLTTITQSALTNSSTSDYDCNFQSNNIYRDRENGDTETQSKILFQAIELLRESIGENMHYLKQVQENNNSLTEFTTGLFWDCIPTLVKNFIGLLTTNDDNFQHFKSSFEYSNLSNQDMYKSCEKSLKISSISYDIINARYSSYSTPKHLLLGNELFHHVRSSHLINIMNRFGHTCSYETIIRLRKKVTDEISNLSLSDLPPTVQQQHSFAITVADNFDMNIGTLHGENSIHILNRIIIQTPVDDELKFDVNGCLNDLCVAVVSALDESNFGLLSNSNIKNLSTCTMPITTNKNEPYLQYEDNSYRDMLLSYGLMKYVYDTNNIFEKVINNQIQINLPLLSGFFATYAPNVHRPLSKITFLSPINQDPSSLTTSESCLQSTKTSLIESGFQKEAVVVVDEKIYSNCLKVKRRDEIDCKLIFLYPGDFHVMKNYMIVIWDVLNGSGVEDILGCIYKGAAHRSIMNVHNFNYSLRCCKLVYTALAVLFFNSFIKTLSSSSSTSTTKTNIIMKLKEILKCIPSDYVGIDKKQEWFFTLINEIEDIKLADVMDQWAVEQCERNQAFKFWYFIYRKPIEPLILFYMSIRLSNFNGRNAALSAMAPIFFSTNHRNYARLCLQHLLDLKSCSTYLRERLERTFTVNRTNRPFSAIALDQAIECSINKYGKGRGGISGRLKPESIELWCKSFAFRSMLSSIINEIACIERTNNAIDAHVECSIGRMIHDNEDLLIITKASREENLFEPNNIHVRKIFNGKIIHEKIVENVVTMYENGSKRMHLFIQERYIDHSIKIDDRLPAMLRYKLSDSYVSNDEQRPKKKRNNNVLLVERLKSADNTIKDIISLSCFRELDMNLLFAHEFTSAPLSLSDHQDCNLLNQQQKSEIIKLFEKEYPTGFSTTNPTVNNGKWALVIDGGQLLEIRPLKINGTIFDYAKQLLLKIIIPEFRIYDRIDIVFDSDQSKVIKSFIKRHGHENKKQQQQQQQQQQQYDLKQNDILESSRFHEFVHSNRAKLAAVVRSCWSQDELIDILPVYKHLIIAGPQQETIKLINNNNISFDPSSEILHSLELNHVEADTRIFLHVYDIQMDDDDGRFDGIVIQSNDTDVFILSIAHIHLMMLPNYFIKKFNTSTKLSTFINIKEIGKSIKNKWNINEPNVFLTLHAISGCDTTSFTRNITKVNYFTTFLSNPNQFQDLLNFGNHATITNEPLKAAEDLLVSCYKNSRGLRSSILQKTTLAASSSLSSATTTTTTKPLHDTSLDSLRRFMALKYFKNQTSDICVKLPPTSNSFNQHCQRAWRQVFIWKKAFEQFDIISHYSIEDYGYERTNDGELIIRWMTMPATPDDISLKKCVKCTSGCHQCKCSRNNLLCTPFCGCSPDQCMNRTNMRMKIQTTQILPAKPKSSLMNKSSFDDDYDEDTVNNIQVQNQTDSDSQEDGDNNDGEEDALEHIYEHI